MFRNLLPASRYLFLRDIHEDFYALRFRIFGNFRLRFRRKQRNVGRQVPVPADGRQAYGKRHDEPRHKAGGRVDAQIRERGIGHAAHERRRGIQFTGTENVGNVSGQHIAQQASRHAGADPHHHGNGRRIAVQI